MGDFSGFSLSEAPVPEQKIVQTKVMVRAREETKYAVKQNTGCLWTGAAGVGKTVTARWMCDGLRAEFQDSDRSTVRAAYWEAVSGQDAPREAKEVMGYLYRAVTGQGWDPGVVRGEDIDFVEGLVRTAATKRRVRLFFIDEAQLLPRDAMGALVRFFNGSRDSRWPLTPVLIATGTLPEVILSTPPLRRRFAVRVPLEPVREEDIERFIATLFPEWFSEGVPSEVIAYVQKETGGNLDEMNTVLGLARQVVSRMGGALDVKVLQAAQHLRRRATESVLAIQRRGYAPRLPDTEGVA